MGKTLKSINRFLQPNIHRIVSIYLSKNYYYSENMLDEMDMLWCLSHTSKVFEQKCYETQTASVLDNFNWFTFNHVNINMECDERTVKLLRLNVPENDTSRQNGRGGASKKKTFSCKHLQLKRTLWWWILAAASEKLLFSRNAILLFNLQHGYTMESNTHAHTYTTICSTIWPIFTWTCSMFAQSRIEIIWREFSMQTSRIMIL